MSSVTPKPANTKSERLAALREQIMRRKGSFAANANPFIRDVALWRAAKRGRSRMQMRAAFLKELVELAPIEFPPDWSLAGEHLALGYWFKLTGTHLPENIDRIREFDFSDSEIEEVHACVREWQDRRSGRPGAVQAIGETNPDCEAGRLDYQLDWRNARGVFSGKGWSENHSVRDFARVIRKGFAGLRREIEERLATLDIADPDRAQKENAWSSLLSVCDAGVRLGQRYAERARSLATSAATAEERKRLETLAALCERVPAEGARTFREATQTLWLAHILTCGEDCINANSIGRLDQILWPYYQADREAGCLARDEAVALMEELACKLYLEYDVQAIVLGGVDANGEKAIINSSRQIIFASPDNDFARAARKAAAELRDRINYCRRKPP